MTGSAAYQVDTTSRLAQWRIHNLPSSTFRKSDPFKIANWNWSATFSCFSTLPYQFMMPFLKFSCSFPQGGEPCSIWNGGFARRQSNDAALALLGRMLSEGIQTDVMISASDGSISAHRAVLASRSPVFHSMFLHDVEGKGMAAINISDMPMEACKALLNYIYGSIKNEEFLPHRLSLLHAADKFGISDLKEVCHDSLLEDIDTTNVLERLQTATLYQLPKLKTSCMLYLVKFGKIFDIRDEFRTFLVRADRELVAEIFEQVLGAWKGF